MKEYIFETEDEAASGATIALQKSLTDAKSQDKYVLLLLSGGSAFKLLTNSSTELLGSNVTISVVDERFSTDPAENNFSQLMATDFYKKAEEKGCQFIDTRVIDGESRDEFTLRFNTALQSWISDNPNGEIIATMGIGPDGHSAGIMPYPENSEKFKTLFVDTEAFVVGYDATGKTPYPQRVTTTPYFLKTFITKAIVYAAGKNKKDALIRLRAEKGFFAETPARILREMKEVLLFTDIK